ncbi:MAG: putative quinol monooxygenase [Pseudomonadota bacterium]
MIGLVVTLKVQPGKEAEFEAVMKDAMAKVKANEPGVMIYQLFKSQSEDGTYVMMEQYSSKEALDAHGKTPHMAEMITNMGPCLDGRPQFQFLDLVE